MARPRGHDPLLRRRCEEAVAQFQAALALNPNSASVHFPLAFVRRRLRRTVDANEHYREAIRLHPALAR